MRDRRPDKAGAGVSASIEWRRARVSAYWRRIVAAVLAIASGGLLTVALWRADGRPLVLGVLVGLIAWRCRPIPDADRWRRGAEGEVATAALLAGLSRRWVVLHDRAVPGTRANIDHLVIGPTGVWVVDTKSTRAWIRVRRGAVWAGDHPIELEPVAWEADVVADCLGVGTVPIVAVHGDGLRGRGKLSGGVRVVPAERLVRRLRRGRRRLRRSEVAALARLAEDCLPRR